MADPSARVATTLRALSRRDQVYILSYAVLNANGTVVFDTDAAEVGADQARHDYFRQPLATGLPYISSVEFLDSASQPSIYFSAPIRDVPGNIIGVLRMRYDATILQQILAGTSGLAGQASYAVLLDENHLRLAVSQQPDLSFTTVVALDPAR